MFLDCAFILAIPCSPFNDSTVFSLSQTVSYPHITEKEASMTPGSTSYENILEVENQGSQLSRFFKLLAPVQITLESCTGLGETDQYSIQMYSPNGCWLHENSMDSLFRTLSSRPLHRHDYFELMLVLEGEVIQQIEEKEYPYRAGTCCLVNRNILHNERFIGPAKLCFLGLSVDFVRSLTESASLQLFEAERHLPENPVLQFMLANLGQDLRKEYQDLFPTPENTDSVQTLATLIARMTHILHEPSAAATYYLKGALCELFDFLSSGFYVTPVHLSSSPESLLFLRISRLLEDTDGRLPRSELARLLNYNGSYLNSIVQHRTGLCLFDYGMTFCFQKAERLLRETTLSVSEIALQLKFTNRTHFYELFRQKYGMTPQQWRKMQKSAEHSE
ncbi:MAG: helix-turn-helix transcriptional regulator [Faecalibacterium prausnitzii]|nr:helix-turn-helix transcriptional regulator [Faecalibacterium prausnitzii]